MRCDRLIKLFIGEQSPEMQPLLVPQALLENASEYFVKAFRNENMGQQNEPGTLRFPEDDIAAWKVFLYWIIKHKLPAAEELVPACDDENVEGKHDHILAVRCWVLGDKYCVPLFQDLIMLEILRTLEHSSTTNDSIMEAFSTTSS